MYIGGLDIGTSGCKITVYDEKGNYIENHYREYESLHSGGMHEIDANEIAEAVKSVISKTESIPEALGITSFGESFILLDKDDNILAPTMLYTDPRADISVFDKQEIQRIAGCAPHGMYSLPKLVWIKKNNPELYEKTAKILLMQDFVGYLLTGNACIDYSLAARTMGFDIRNKVWNESLFERAGIDVRKMSTPVASGTVIGVSNKFGLKNTKIVAGCHDQVASAIGAGAHESGIAVDGSGTVECITPVFDDIPKDLSACECGFSFVPYLDDKYVCYAFSFTGGAALKWFKDNFAEDEKYSELDKKIGDKCGEALLLPHFAGSATPYMDGEAKAMLANVTLETTKYDIYRAVMEGVAYEMRINTDALEKYGIAAKKLLATGGGAKSPAWLQIKADILGTPVTKIDAPEVGTLGTVMVAACGLGVFDSLQDAAKVFIKTGETYYPDVDKHKEYTRLYEKYKKMYETAKELR